MPELSHRESDEALVAQVREGDMEAFDRLYRRYAPRLFGYLLRSCGQDRARAEDHFQAVFMKVLEDRSFDAERGRFAAWLFTVARNRVRASHRQESGRAALRAERLAPLAASAAAELDEAVDHRRRVHAAMAELSEAHRQVLLLKQLGGLTYAEIASALDVAEGTIKSRLHAAMKAFRSHLAAGVIEGEGA